MYNYENLRIFPNHGTDNKYSSHCDWFIYLTSAVKDTSQGRGQMLPLCIPRLSCSFCKGGWTTGPNPVGLVEFSLTSSPAGLWQIPVCPHHRAIFEWKLVAVFYSKDSGQVPRKIIWSKKLNISFISGYPSPSCTFLPLAVSASWLTSTMGQVITSICNR